MVKSKKIIAHKKNHPLSEMQEDYIRAIYVLQHRTQKNPMLNEIAEYLKIKKKTTISEALKTLHDIGFVIKIKYKPIHLTAKGLQFAKILTWKHRLIELFLYRFLDIPIDELHEEAHKLEHSFSDSISNALYKFVTNPRNSIKKIENYIEDDVLKCPHGQPLPNISEQ